MRSDVIINQGAVMDIQKRLVASKVEERAANGTNDYCSSIGHSRNSAKDLQGNCESGNDSSCDVQVYEKYTIRTLFKLLRKTPWQETKV